MLKFVIITIIIFEMFEYKCKNVNLIKYSEVSNTFGVLCNVRTELSDRRHIYNPLTDVTRAKQEEKTSKKIYIEHAHTNHQCAQSIDGYVCVCTKRAISFTAYARVCINIHIVPMQIDCTEMRTRATTHRQSAQICCVNLFTQAPRIHMPQRVVVYPLRV